ncbi:MAG: hypothetical protein K5686_11425 [Lachnospiraceae bacterium]|nr:hypothetical protein [Lachnospiraceae bacterium]
MKKEDITNEKNSRVNLPVACIFCLLAAVVLRQLIRGYFDNDFYHIASSGRWIAEHGMMYENPYFVLEGYAAVIQQWLYALMLYGVYAFAGDYGVLLFVMLQALMLGAFVYLYLRLRKTEWRVALCGTLLFLIALPEKNCRPEMITLCMLTAQLCCVEHYRQNGRRAVLWLLPLLSLLEINIHAAYALFHFVILLPYLLPVHRLPMIRETESCFGISADRIAPGDFLFPGVAMAAVMAVNPYGLSAVTFLFRSGAISKLAIREQQPLKITDPPAAYVFIALLLLFITVYFKKLRQSSLLLFAGFLLLALLARKNIMLFVLAFPACYADLMADADAGKYIDALVIRQKKCRRILVGMTVLGCAAIIIYQGAVRLTLTKEGGLEAKAAILPAHNDCEMYPALAIRYILEHESDPSELKLMCSFNNGAAFIWNGIGHVYIEPKTEPYLEGINKKADVISEYCYMINYASSDDLDLFLEKYDFDYICCSLNMDALRVWLEQSGEYRKVLCSEHVSDTIADMRGDPPPDYILFEKLK